MRKEAVIVCPLGHKVDYIANDRFWCATCAREYRGSEVKGRPPTAAREPALPPQQGGKQVHIYEPDERQRDEINHDLNMGGYGEIEPGSIQPQVHQMDEWDDFDSPVDQAIEILNNHGATEPSSSGEWSKGLWYSNPDEHYLTGHLEGFTPEEERAIWAGMKAKDQLWRNPIPDTGPEPHPDPWMDSEPGTVTFPEAWNRTSKSRSLYHGTLIDHLPSIQSLGVIPNQGDFSNYAYDDIPAEHRRDMSFWTDKNNLQRAHNAISFHVERKLGLGRPPTRDEIKEHGLLVKSPGQEGASTQEPPTQWLHPDESGWHDWYSVPPGVEGGDYWDEDPVGDVVPITGEAMMRVFDRAGLATPPRPKGYQPGQQQIFDTKPYAEWDPEQPPYEESRLSANWPTDDWDPRCLQADENAWTPGSFGKGYVHPERARTWNVTGERDGLPWHADMLAYDGFDRDQGWRACQFNIAPDGQVKFHQDDAGKEWPDQIKEAALGMHPELHHADQGGPPDEGYGHAQNILDKLGMALDPQDAQSYIQEHGPYLEHWTEAHKVPSIMRHGLEPSMPDYQDDWGDPDAPVEEGGANWKGFLQTRPYHVYLATPGTITPNTDTGTMGNKPYQVPVRVDLRKLDPKRLKADEDHAQNAWSDWTSKDPDLDEWSLPPPTSDMYEPESGYGLGDWAEEVGLDNPSWVNESLTQNGSISHEGPIPPEALSLHPDYMDKYPPETLAVNREQMKLPGVAKRAAWEEEYGEPPDEMTRGAWCPQCEQSSDYIEPVKANMNPDYEWYHCNACDHSWPELRRGHSHEQAQADNEWEQEGYKYGPRPDPITRPEEGAQWIKEDQDTAAKGWDELGYGEEYPGASCPNGHPVQVGDKGPYCPTCDQTFFRSELARTPWEAPEAHPDPWMDNEPGTVTFPKAWTAAEHGDPAGSTDQDYICMHGHAIPAGTETHWLSTFGLEPKEHVPCKDCGIWYQPKQLHTDANSTRIIPPMVPDEMPKSHPDPWMDNEPGSLTLPEGWTARRKRSMDEHTYPEPDDYSYPEPFSEGTRVGYDNHRDTKFEGTVVEGEKGQEGEADIIRVRRDDTGKVCVVFMTDPFLRLLSPAPDSFEHPDPWMDDEPGTTTFPDSWSAHIRKRAMDEWTERQYDEDEGKKFSPQNPDWSLLPKCPECGDQLEWRDSTSLSGMWPEGAWQCLRPGAYHMFPPGEIAPEKGPEVADPSKHPDPWMDNEPGTVTFPERWNISKVADVEGYTNWETFNVGVNIDNDQQLQEAARELVQNGAGPDELRDWAIKTFLGRQNAGSIEDARSWNEIPKEERLDHHYEDLKNKNPEAAELVDNLGFGPDVGDMDPAIVDPEMVNWNELVNDIKSDMEENDQYDQEHQRLEGLGLAPDWLSPGHDDETQHMREAMYRYHGALPEGEMKADWGGGYTGKDPRAYQNRKVNVPFDELVQRPGFHLDSHISLDTRNALWSDANQRQIQKILAEKQADPKFAEWNPTELQNLAENIWYRHTPLRDRDKLTEHRLDDPNVQAIINQDPQWQQTVRNGYDERLHDYTWDTINDIKRGQAQPRQMQEMQEALAQRGHTPEQVANITRQQRYYEPETDRWIDMEPSTYNPNEITPDDQPGDLTLPQEWTAHNRRAGAPERRARASRRSSSTSTQPPASGSSPGTLWSEDSSAHSRSTAPSFRTLSACGLHLNHRLILTGSRMVCATCRVAVGDLAELRHAEPGYEMKCPTCGDKIHGPSCPRCNWGVWQNQSDPVNEYPQDPTRDVKPAIQA